MAIDGEKMSVKNIDLYKRALKAERKKDAVSEGTFKPINNQGFTISIMVQIKTLMACTNNKRWILDDNTHIVVCGHYKIEQNSKTLEITIIHIGVLGIYYFATLSAR